MIKCIKPNISLDLFPILLTTNIQSSLVLLSVGLELGDGSVDHLDCKVHILLCNAHWWFDAEYLK